MDTFLFSFVAAAIASLGDRAQLLAALLGAKRQQPLQVLAGLLIAAAVVAAIAAAGGAALHALVNVRAQTLLVALALAYAGIVALLTPSPPGLAARFRGGSFLTAVLFGFAFASGSRAQFLILALAARAEVPELAAIGGTLGIVAAAAPAAVLGKTFLELKLRGVRIAIAAFFLLAAAMVLVSAPAS